MQRKFYLHVPTMDLPYNAVEINTILFIRSKCDIENGQTLRESCEILTFIMIRPF